MSITLDDAVQAIVVELQKMPGTTDKNETLWQDILREIQDSNAIHEHNITQIEEAIETFLRDIASEDKVALWKMTDAERAVYLKNTRMLLFDIVEEDLEAELLDEVSDLAYCIADNR